ncbi:MAG: BatD family protein [Phycisphaerae bacterium]|nr:BatD family protein [Phycisphaerae bacterium]
MNSQTLKKQLFFLWAMLLICQTATFAADRQVVAMAQKVIYVGKPFVYLVAIEGDRSGVEGINIDSLEGFNPRGAGEESRNINGRKTFRINIQLTTNKLGKATIPPVTVKIDGKVYTTNSIAIDVIKPGDQFAFDVSYSDSKCYVGQPVIMTVKWICHDDFSSPSLDIPALQEDGKFIYEEPQATPGSDSKMAKIGNRKITYHVYDGKYKDKKASILEFSKILIPQKPGKISLGAATASCQESSAGPFGGFSQGRTYTKKSPAKTLTVIPLPTENQPADFNGLIGRYSIRTTAEPKACNVGTPITLKMIITGPLLKTVTMPDLDFMANDFKIPDEYASPEITNRQVVYTQTVRAKRSSEEGLTEIPPISLSYFDVDSGQYVTRYSQPIPIKIEATRVVTAAEGQGVIAATRQGSELEKTRRGMAANVEGPKLLAHQAFTLSTVLVGPLGVALWAAPAGLFMISLLWRIISHTNPQRQKAQRKARACSRALARLKKINDPHSDDARQQIADVLRQYIGDRFDKNSPSLTPMDCQAILIENNCSQELTEQFCQMLQHCEESLFAGGGGGAGQLDSTQIIELMTKIEKT